MGVIVPVNEGTPSIVVIPIVGESRGNYKKVGRPIDKRKDLGLPVLPWAFKNPKKPEGVPFQGDLVLFIFSETTSSRKFEFSLERVVTGCRKLTEDEAAFGGFPWQFETEVFDLSDSSSSQYFLEKEKDEPDEDFWSRGISAAKEVLAVAIGLDSETKELDLVFRQATKPKPESYMQGGMGAKPAVFLYDPDTHQYQRASSTSTKGKTISPKPQLESSVEQMSGTDEVGIESLLLLYRNVVVEGVAGTGKSHLIKELREGKEFEETEVVVFHPSTAFEDFVEGIRPVGDGFEVRDGRFLEFCRRAAAAAAAAAQDSLPEPKFLFVIDEINRANTSKVLGDLLYSLEPSKRVDACEAHKILSAKSDTSTLSDEISVLLPATRFDEETNKNYHQRFAVPSNVYVLGTMNTTDRSVGQIDLALRRRFMFTRMLPMNGVELLEKLDSKDAPATDKEFFEKHIKIWETVNKVLEDSIGPDAQIGHSYFFQVKEMMNSEAGREIMTGDGDPLPQFLWKSLLLPQIAEILVSFNAVHAIDAINAALTSDTGYTLKRVGTGLDEYPMVVQNGQ